MTHFLTLLLVSSYLYGEPKEHLITSSHLGYDLKYWVHVPAGHSSKGLPVLYVTDGKWYREGGDLINIANGLVRDQKVEPHIIVLVDAFDPHRPDRNRRNSQFLCNPDYVKFYRDELIPEVEAAYETDKNPEKRGILGLSFGGLNSMFFATRASDLFGKVGIQSPAPHPCPSIYGEFENAERLPIDIYLSTGTVNDKARDTRRLKEILDAKGYEFRYQEVAQGHNWKNWKPLLDDVLLYFYGT